MEYEVKDGSRTYKVEGELLAESSSRTPYKDRWVEFKLYRTLGGQYVVSRIGVSQLFHDPSCPIVKRNGLKLGTPNENALPCGECQPEPGSPIAVETDRYWVQISDVPDAVIDALHKYDDAGVRYLTHAARTLIERASLVDRAIAQAYSVERIA